MPTGFSSNLVSEGIASALIAEHSAAPLPLQELKRWWRSHVETLGPASSPRALYASAASLCGLLGYRALPGLTVGEGTAAGLMVPSSAAAGSALPTAAAGPMFPAALMVFPWHEPVDTRWRDAVRHAVEVGSGWCFSFNGRQLRLIDARRTFARRHLEFDLALAVHDDRSLALLWSLFHATARLDSIIERSAREMVEVCGSLRDGVLEALTSLLEGLLLARRSSKTRSLRAGRARSAPALDSAHEQALTLVYRILFLLFAEARRLVPSWHPIYRESYSLESLCSLMQDGTRPAAIWETLQAIWRLAHSGCRAEDLRVTGFNGRLFSPSGAPLAEGVRVADEYARRAIVALTTTRSRPGGRRRVTYRDLGVEQLGGVYENVLDYSPEISEDDSKLKVSLREGTGRRKSTGTFYTPRSITDFLVRRTLHPLVDGSTPESILRLRVLDPTMGSGAFLVSACRYLASAYEAALIRRGDCRAADLGDRNRAQFRRAIAQRCLFGVDLNPMAVQLARLSLWLSTLASDRPLTFLDHRLICGNSLVGAAPEDILRQPPGIAGARRSAAASLPLFDPVSFELATRSIVPLRLQLASDPDDEVSTVKEKDRILSRLAHPAAPWSRWTTLADLWCACWFWGADRTPPDRATYLELAERITSGRSSLPSSVADSLVSHAREIAAEERFFHWPLQFPEAFFHPDGSRRPDAGFDAILGNPPWEMMRADSGGVDERRRVQRRLARMIRFVRSSGVYRTHTEGHPNQYQLFLDRAIQLARPGGRIGLVLPWGLASDVGSAPLRRLLFQRCDTDMLVAFDNASAIFPIHRSVRFLLITTTKDFQGSSRIGCRLGERDPSTLDTIPDQGPAGDSHAWLILDANLLERLSGHDLAMPYLKTSLDLTIAERLSAGFPPLGHPTGWGASFGRELNASEDRRHFRGLDKSRDERDLLPVLDGKHIEPFQAHVASTHVGIPAAVAGRLVEPARTFRRARLAYRDVASSTNLLTLIAAVLPAGCLTTHTLFCLKTPFRAEEQDCLCAVLNSYVANYLVRQRVSSHVTVAVIERLPVPRPDFDSDVLRELARLSRRLASRAPGADLFQSDDYVRVQVLAAGLYGLSGREFEHVLETFPLVPEEARRMTLEAFRLERQKTLTN